MRDRWIFIMTSVICTTMEIKAKEPEVKWQSDWQKTIIHADITLRSLGHWWVLRKSTGRWQERSNDGALLLTARAGPPRALSVWPLTSAPLMSELQHMFNDSVCNSADRGEMSSNNHLSFALNIWLSGWNWGEKVKIFLQICWHEDWSCWEGCVGLNKAWLIPV